MNDKVSGDTSVDLFVHLRAKHAFDDSQTEVGLKSVHNSAVRILLCVKLPLREVDLNNIARTERVELRFLFCLL